MNRIGIIGVGVIGKLFVDRLSETDRSVVVHDVEESQEAYAVERGASRAESPRDLAERTDAVVMALPGTPEVEATMEGDDGIVAALEAGQLVVDATTTLPETSIAVESICDERGAAFVEAPITGAAPRDGWQMMVGGSEESYEVASDLLDDLCDDHVRIGEAGTATTFKLALQMRYAGHNAVDAEVVEFLRDNGVDPEPLNDFLGMGVWENYFTDDFGQEIEGLGGLAIWHKDVGYARRVAHETGTALPINAVVHEAYKATMRDVREDEGHAAALIGYWRKLNGRRR